MVTRVTGIEDRVRKANFLLAGGIALLVIGVGVVAWFARDDGGSDTPRVTVLVARDAITAGEAGRDVIADGRADVAKVAADRVPANALVTADQLDGAIFTTNVGKGDAIVFGHIRTTSLGQGSIKIPEGKQAIALAFEDNAGGAGYAGPGDRINIYVNIEPGTPGAPESPLSRLLLSNIEVLDISAEVSPRRAMPEDSTATAAPGRLTVLVAVDAQQAEQLIFASEQNELWLTVLPEGQAESSTDGVTYAENYLEPIAATATPTEEATS